jgi:predicted deacylase
MITFDAARSNRGRIVRTAIDESDGARARFRLPVIMVIGKREGKTLFIDAAQHEEFQGTGAIKQILETMDPERVRGNIIFLPIVDTMKARAALRRGRRRRHQKAKGPNDMHVGWPYGDKATLKDRVKGIIFDEYLSKADAFVDVHSWTLACVPAITVTPHCKESLELAIATGYPTISVCKNPTGKDAKASLRHINSGMFMGVPELGIPGFTLESTNGPGAWITKGNMDCVQTALENLMKYMKILPGRPRYRTDTMLVTLNEKYLHARKSGMAIPERRLGEIVEKGDAILSIYDIETFKLLEKITSPVRGLFWGHTMVPAVNKGDYVALVKGKVRVIKHR